MSAWSTSTGFGGFGKSIGRGGKWAACRIASLPDVTVDCSEPPGDVEGDRRDDALLDGLGDVTSPPADTITVWDPELGAVVEMTREEFEAARAAGAALREVDENDTIVVRNEAGEVRTTTWDVFLEHLKDEGWRISSRDETEAKLDDQGRLILMGASGKLAAVEIPDGLAPPGKERGSPEFEAWLRSDEGRAAIEKWLADSGIADQLRLPTGWDLRIAENVDASAAIADNEQTDVDALEDEMGVSLAHVAADPETRGLSERPDVESRVPGMTEWTLEKLYVTRFPTWEARWAAMDEWGDWAADRFLNNMRGVGQFAVSPLVDLANWRLFYPEGHTRSIPNIGLYDDFVAGMGLAVWDQLAATVDLAWNVGSNAIVYTVKSPWLFSQWMTDVPAWQEWWNSPESFWDPVRYVPYGRELRANSELMGPFASLLVPAMPAVMWLDGRARMDAYVEDTCHGTGTEEDCAEFYGRVSTVVAGPWAISYLRTRYSAVLPRPRNPNAPPKFLDHVGQIVSGAARDVRRRFRDGMGRAWRATQNAWERGMRIAGLSGGTSTLPTRRPVAVRKPAAEWRNPDGLKITLPSERRRLADAALPPVELPVGTALGIAATDFEGETFLGHPVTRRRVQLEGGGHVDEYWTRPPGRQWRLLGRVYREGDDGRTGPSVTRSVWDRMPRRADEGRAHLTTQPVVVDGEPRRRRYIGVVRLPGDGGDVVFEEVGEPQRSHARGTPRDPYRAALEAARYRPGDMRVLMEHGPEQDWIVTFIDPPEDPGGYDRYHRFLARKLGDIRAVHRFEPAVEADGVRIVGMEPEPRSRSDWPPGETERLYAKTGVGLHDPGFAPSLSELDQIRRTRGGELPQPMLVFNRPFHVDVGPLGGRDRSLNAEKLARIRRIVEERVRRSRAGIRVPDNEDARQREEFQRNSAIERGVRDEVQRREHQNAALQNLRYLNGEGRWVWVDDSPVLSAPDPTQRHVLVIAPNDVRTTPDGDPTFTGANVYGAPIDQNSTPADYGDLLRRYGVPVDLNPRGVRSDDQLGAVVGVDVFPAIDAEPHMSRMIVHVDQHPSMLSNDLHETAKGPNKGQVVETIASKVRDFVQAVYPDVQVVHPAELFVGGTMPRFGGSIDDMERIVRNSPVLSPASKEHLLDQPPFTARGPDWSTTPDAVVTFDYELVHGYTGENVQLTHDQLAWALDHLSHVNAIYVKEPSIDTATGRPPTRDGETVWRRVTLKPKTWTRIALEVADTGLRSIPYGLSRIPDAWERLRRRLTYRD